MALQRRSVGTSISTAVSSATAVVEAVAVTVEQVATMLPKGVERISSTLEQSLDITDLYLTNWQKDKKLSNAKESISRRAQYELILQEAKKNKIVDENATVENLLKELEKY